MGKDQNRYRRYLNTFILHFRPRNVPERTLRFTLTWGLGGMAFVLVTLLIGTGLLLKFFYLPSPEKAYESVLYLQNTVLFGQLIRNIHHWRANLALVVVFLHLIRVFLMGAFHPPRRFILQLPGDVSVGDEGGKKVRVDDQTRPGWRFHTGIILFAVGLISPVFIPWRLHPAWVPFRLSVPKKL